MEESDRMQDSVSKRRHGAGVVITRTVTERPPPPTRSRRRDAISIVDVRWPAAGIGNRNNSIFVVSVRCGTAKNASNRRLYDGRSICTYIEL